MRGSLPRISTRVGPGLKIGIWDPGIRRSTAEFLPKFVAHQCVVTDCFDVLFPTEAWGVMIEFDKSF